MNPVGSPITVYSPIFSTTGARSSPPCGFRRRRIMAQGRRCLAPSGLLFARILLLLGVHLALAHALLASCAAPKNAIEAENCLPGNPSSQWYVPGSPNIQGFATDISVNAGQTVFFKISTNAASYSVNIYRLGYYQGQGARLVASFSPSATLPQVQPACLTDSATGLIDCGNWAVSASWVVPSNATSGIYLATLVRSDTGEASSLVFVVRNDSSHSDILVQTSDLNWQAYNDFGGNSLYVGNPAGRAYKVSYNRPVPNVNAWLFGAEYPMLRWLEANGYDVTYFSGVDTDRNGTFITQHRVFASVGHDEYWSGGQRASVEAARAAGVNLAFFSGNEIFWKTRWEPSIDGTSTPYRTLVCYKETLANAVIDPADPPTWTGNWRDPRFSPPADGGRPENALSGTLSGVSSPRNDPITVPQADGRMRFWRNTSIAALAPGQVATLPSGVLGYEWDVDSDNGFRPAGLVPLSTTTLTVPTCIVGYTIGTCTATHHLTLYRASSGALVFGAGTVQWSWGLDANHANSGTPTDINMQQATVNLLADMGVQPATLQSGLLPATPSTDSAPPRSVITSPSSGTPVTAGTTLTVSGTAIDSGGGVVGAVEVSLDGGKTWHPATGRESWSYSATVGNTGTLDILSRAVDDSGNVEVPGPGLTVVSAPPSCPCTIWPSTAVPATDDAGAYSPLELGVRFTADTPGYITGIRFYKSSANTGTHAGNLWSASGALLATATFTAETALGWQQVNFSSPVAMAANTIYVASYQTSVGHFALDQGYFAASGVDSSPLHALADNALGPNDVYMFTTAGAFPTNSYNASNYWVDVVFNYSSGSAGPLIIRTQSLPNASQSLPYSQILVAAGGSAPYSWSLLSGTLPSGLTLSASGQISGTAAVAGTSNFVVQVADSSVPANTASQSLSITVVPSVGPQNDARLLGDYAFSFSGMIGKGTLSGAFATVGRFTADGAGNLANGELVNNSPASAAASPQAFTGTYSIGPDLRGVMTVNLSSSSATLAFVMLADGTARFIEFDASGSAGIIGSGTMERADTTAYSTARIGGGYTFAAAGFDNSNNRAAITGRFTADGAGSLTSAAGDVNAYGTDSAMNFTAANYAVSNSATGRGSMQLAFTFGGASATLNFVFYVVNSGKLFVMESDAVTSATPLLNGVVVQQQIPAGGFSNSALNGNLVISLTGLSTCGSDVGVPKAVVGLLTADGAGNLSLTYDENFCRAPNSVTGATGTYNVAGNGRAAISIGGYSLVGFLSNSNQLFLFVSDSNVLFGIGEPQASAQFTNNTLNGSYAGFTRSPVSFAVSAFSGEFSANGAGPTGNVNGTEDISTANGTNPGASFSASYSVSPSPTNGRGLMTVTSGVGGNAVIYMVSASKFVAISLSDPNPAVMDFEASSTAQALSLSSLTLNPTSVTGGNSSTGTVTLSGPAPTGGAQVALSSSNPGVASVPATVTVVAGASGASFTVSTTTVSSSTSATITGTYSGASKSAALTVAPAPPPPPTLSSLTLNPASLVGGLGSSTGTVTLTGPAPAGGAQVFLTSNNGSASVPSSVTIPAGATTTTFTVGTSIVLIATSAQITASYNSSTRSATLTLLL